MIFLSFETFNSDGRVSEGTTNLIRSLLVLQPNLRLSAVEVLQSLSVIIATFKVPPVIGDDEQVVPDINDRDKEIAKKTKISENKSVPKALSGFLKQVRLQVSDTNFKIN